MDISAVLIKEKNFISTWKQINTIFNIHTNLPDQVFNPSFHYFLFEEFDWAMTPEFFTSTIQPLLQISQDSHIIVSTLDPEPVNYFYNTFGYYNLIYLDAHATGDAYWKGLETGPANSPADAMLFNSEVVIWMPLSGKWAIWGCRSYGTCVLSFADDSIKKTATAHIPTWKPADIALSKFITMNFKNRNVPSSFSSSFLKNYKND